MSETKILVPYDEYTKMVKDSADLESVKAILITEFPDDTCQLIAIKSILGLIPEKEEEPEEPIEPDDPIVEPEPDPEPTPGDDNDENEETTEPVEP